MSSELPDGILVERAQAGDRTAMDSLVAKYQVKAYQFSFRLCNNTDTAADLVAESFMRVYTALPRFRREAQFSTWLYRIITNCFLDMRKKEKHRQYQSLDETVLMDSDSIPVVESPVEAGERGERQELMRRAVAKLPEYQRAMIVMYHVENLSYEDISLALDLPLGTVKSRLNRARLQLREMLEPYEEVFRG